MIPFRTEAEVAAATPQVVLQLVRQRLIGYPTETVYGLGCLAAAEAVAALAALKGRSSEKPFLLLISDLQMLARVRLRFTEEAERLAAAFWPGPLTLVLPGGERVLPDTLRGPEGGIAVRWTSHVGMARIIQTVGSPITSTSANRPGQTPATDAGTVHEEFGEAERAGALMVLDAGRLVPSAPSTLVDCTGHAPRIVRLGALSAERLRSIVPSVGL